jgi:hypothetical protein
MAEPASGPWTKYQTAAPAPAADSAGPWTKYANSAPAPSWLDDVRDTVKQYWDKVNPISQAQGVADIAQHPLDAAKSYGAANQQLAQKAEDAFKAGNYAEGVRHSLSYLLNGIPGMGSALDEAGNKAGSGDAKGAIADTAALATNLLAAKVGPKVVSAAAQPGAIPAALAKVAPDALTAAVKAGGKDIAAGALKTGAGYSVIHLDPAGEVGSALVGAPVLKAGLKQMGGGLKAAYAAGKESLFPPIPEPAPIAPTGPNPLAAGVTNASTFDPATGQPAPQALAPAAPPAGNASQYATGTLPVPQPAPVAAPPAVPVETPAPITPVQPAAAPGAPEGANAKLSPQEAEWLKKRSADTAAKDDVVAQYASDNGMTKIEAGQPYADLIKSVNQANKDAGIPKKYKLPDITNDAHLKRVDAVNALLDSKNAAAATAKTAANLSAQGVTSAMPERFGVTDPTEVQAMRGALLKIEGANTAQAAPSLADQLQASIDAARAAKKP